jgi:hypothetical protein
MWRESQDAVAPCSYWSAQSETCSDHRAVGASFQLQVSAAAAAPSPQPFVPILITNPGMGQMASSAAVAVGSNVSWAVGAVVSNAKRLGSGLSEVFVPGSTAHGTIAAFTCKPAGNLFAEGRPGALAVMQREVQFTSIGGKQPLCIPYAKMKQITPSGDWRNGIFIHLVDAEAVKFSDFNILGLGKFSGNQRRHCVRLMKEQAAKQGIELAVDGKLLE